MGLKEILAAKKAAAEKEAKENGNGTQVQSTTPAIVQSKPPASIETVQHEDVQKLNANDAHSPATIKGNAEAALAQETLLDANGKPLSGFALVKRRKELAAQAALAPIVKQAEQEKAEGKPVEPFNAQFIVKVQEPIVEIQHVQTEEIAHEAYAKATPETKQAYVDLKERIDNLVNLADTDLKNAMTELKKALMQNTNAVALMLPSDIGQMVIALRKMTGVELAKAEEKKTGKKASKKEATLTAEELEEAFKEL